LVAATAYLVVRREAIQHAMAAVHSALSSDETRSVEMR